MGFIQENKIILQLNINKEYKLIHFSDVHAIVHNEEGYVDKANELEEAWINVRKDFADHFNELCLEEHLIPSKECLDKLIEYANSQNPDVSLLSGDIIDYYSNGNFMYLKESLSKLNHQYLFACGNHETPANLYDDLCMGDAEINHLDFNEIIIVSLDNSTKKFSKKQYEKVLKLTEKNVPILLLMHIPIVTEFNEKDMELYDSYFVIDYKKCDFETLKFINLIKENGNIKAIFCGHVHGASVSNFGLDKPQYCASSGLIGYVNKIILK